MADTIMKQLTTYLNENKITMYYRMILTYNFSDDDTRSSFEVLIEDLGFVAAEDQSTYTLPYVIHKVSKDVIEPIVKWSEDKCIKVYEDDFVQLFYLAFDTIDSKKVYKIASKFLKYNSKTKGFM